MTLVSAKRRARRRARQGGAIVFIVSMTIAVLASLGLFALVSASTEIKSAGYERQALQTHYLAEYGMLAAAQKVDPDYAMAVEAQMRTTSDYGAAFPRHHCISLETVPPTADAISRECKILRLTDLTGGWLVPYNTTPLRPSTPIAPCSLGSVALDGYFTVEITDPQFGQPVTGMATLGQKLLSVCPVTFTVTTFGSTYPNGGAIGIHQAVFGGSGVEQGRGRLTGGPIPCPQ